MGAIKDNAGSGGGSQRGVWNDVKRSRRCPICDGDSWCQIRYDGAYVLCRRNPVGAISTRGGNGKEVYVHVLDADAVGRSDGEMPDGPDESNQIERVGVELLDKTYRFLLSELRLSDAHRDDLRKRGLSDKEIKARGYRSLPFEGRAAIAKRIVERMGEPVARGMPGLYVKKNDDGKTWWTLAGSPGLLIPMRNAARQIFAIKVRRDGPKELPAENPDDESKSPPRYTYVSSAAHDGPKALNGVHVPPMRGKIDYSVARIVEGELKADIAMVLSDIPTISIPGVGGGDYALPILREMGTRGVIVAFDADHTTKPEVGLALVSMCRNLTEFAWMIELWDPAHGNGIDDVLAAGHGESIRLCGGADATKYLAELETKCLAELEEKNQRRLEKMAAAAAAAAAAAVPVAATAPTAPAAETTATDQKVDSKALSDELSARVKAAKKKQQDAEKTKVAEKRVAVHKDSRAAVVADMREQMGLPDVAARAATATMTLGDEPELAYHVLRDLQGDSPERIIYDGGALRLYQPSSGLWNEVTESDFCKVAVQYSGCLVGGPEVPPDKLKKLKLKNSIINGAYDIAQKTRYQPAFFAKAPKGILFTNGFVTVKNGDITLLPHSPDHRALNSMDFAYDRDAKCPQWCEFLDGIFTTPEEIGRGDGEGSHLSPERQIELILDREQKILFVMEFIGASVIGEAVDYAVCLMLVGGGNNGKSTFIDTVKSLFPKKAVSSIAPQEWGRIEFLAALQGIRLNSCAEMPPKEIIDNEAFKSVISGDTKTVRRLYGDPFELTFEAGNMFAGQKLPATRDMSEGFWRRVAPLEFLRAFTNDDRIIGLAKLLIAERPGIMRMALEGAARLQHQKAYTVPESTKLLKKKWRHEQDQVAQWFEECTRTHVLDELEAIAEPGYVPSAKSRFTYGVSAQSIYDSYVTWAKRNGHDRPLSSAHFYPRLKALVPEELRKRSKLCVTYQLRLIELEPAGGYPPPIPIRRGYGG